MKRFLVLCWVAVSVTACEGENQTQRAIADLCRQQPETCQPVGDGSESSGSSDGFTPEMDGGSPDTGMPDLGETDVRPSEDAAMDVDAGVVQPDAARPDAALQPDAAIDPGPWVYFEYTWAEPVQVQIGWSNAAGELGGPDTIVILATDGLDLDRFPVNGERVHSIRLQPASGTWFTPNGEDYNAYWNGRTPAEKLQFCTERTDGQNPLGHFEPRLTRNEWACEFTPWLPPRG